MPSPFRRLTTINVPEGASKYKMSRRVWQGVAVRIVTCKDPEAVCKGE